MGIKSGYGGDRSELVGIIPEGCSCILEIGCASGVFRENFGDCEYWGVECANDTAKLAENRLDRVLIGLFDEVYDDLPDQYFDLIVCNDVIEHMPDHDAFFERIKQKMKPSGRIMGSLPNVRYAKNLSELIFKKDWRYTDVGILDRTHLRFFTKKSMRRTFGEHDYQIEILEGISSCVKPRWYRTSWLLLLKILIFGRDSRFLQFCFLLRFPG